MFRVSSLALRFITQSCVFVQERELGRSRGTQEAAGVRRPGGRPAPRATVSRGEERHGQQGETRRALVTRPGYF